MSQSTSVAAITAPVPLKAEVESTYSSGSRTTHAIGNGSILVEVGADMPASLLLRSDFSLSGWAVVGNIPSALEEEMRDAGWVFFFLAGEIATTVFGFGELQTSRAALKELAGKVKSLNCNSFEISHIARKSFMGVSRVSISAHARRLQKGSAFFGR